MTLAQIFAIMSLLVAFGVDAPTVETVRGILMQDSPVVETFIAPVKAVGDAVPEPVIERKKIECSISAKVSSYYPDGVSPHEVELSWSYNGSEEGTVERSREVGGTKFKDKIDGLAVEFVPALLATHNFNEKFATSTNSWYNFFKLSFPDGTKCYAKTPR